MRLAITAFCCLIVAGLFAGCRTLPPLSRVDLSQPGWVVRQGQALWRAKTGAPEIAGELLFASRPGETFVQFSKDPFPMVIARTSRKAWQIEAPMENRSYTGHGHPPARILWFHLPGLLAHEPAPSGWSWQTLADDHWRLSNPDTGESLEGYLNE